MGTYVAHVSMSSLGRFGTATYFFVTSAPSTQSGPRLTLTYEKASYKYTNASLAFGVDFLMNFRNAQNACCEADTSRLIYKTAMYKTFICKVLIHNALIYNAMIYKALIYPAWIYKVHSATFFGLL